ncbi:hypothetical protein H9Q16_02070 [Sulfitobacter sp. TSTF-M16]|uniref:Uncharacterized protein n=2 Tax=Sulfitobacter aestuariivivens TaxID=2766981 RepID=A0A927D1M6_9RHOB|nr:hypothetical protein [Sulfitobacter aestuariivivens]
MNITLHIGAHRTATTTFQHYLGTRTDMLTQQSALLWGPGRTRKGLINGLYHAAPQGWKARKDARKARGRVRLQVRQAAMSGIEHLIVSDENMIGSTWQCIRSGRLYPSIGERLARLGDAFGQDINRVVLSIRSQELWWASAMAYAVSRGHPVPSGQTMTKIADDTRSWRDVITDVSCAIPDADLRVITFEEFAGQPHQTLAVAADVDAPLDPTVPWLNRSPDRRALRILLQERGEDVDLIPDGVGRWQPFTDAQAACLREQYADDLHWLIAGADGLATLIQDPARIETGTSLQVGALTEGHGNDNGQERLARPG